AGKTVYEIAPKELADVYYRADNELFTHPGSQVYEACVRSVDGVRHEVVFHKATFEGPDGVLAGLIGAVVDITERKRAEEALKESEEKYRSMMEAMEDAVYIGSPDFRVEYQNLAMTKRIGRDATGEPCYKAVHGVDEKCSGCIHEKVMGGESIKTETMSPFDRKTYIISHSPIFHTDGSVSNLAIFHDITETKKMAERLDQAQRMEAIGTLAGGIAHDFNNILFPIIGLSELLMEDLPAGSLTHENAAQIHKAGGRARDLVKQILFFSRQAIHKKVPVGIQYILKEVLKLTRATIPSNIEITQYIQSDCGLVMADPTQLHQIAMNLITNAYHAVEEAGGALSVNLKEMEVSDENLPGISLQAGRYAVLSISDSGCGIAPAIMGRIFEPYFTTKALGKGTGLGLSVVYGIVKDHGGEIRVYSELGQGTTFNVYLPLLGDAMKTEAPDEPIIYETGTERILLVDDEEPIIRLEQLMLEKLGYQVTTRTSSLEALAVFKANPDRFDLVITDLTMPNLMGTLLAGELKSIKPGVPVILCTGFSARIDEKKAMAMGVNGFLMKPIVKSDLARMVRKVLEEGKEGKV
ncbi:MAG: ATP-binding protein, partial [Pseudomonadota bacterium]